MVKKSETPAATVLAAPGLGQGTWIVQTGRCGRPRWVERWWLSMNRRKSTGFYSGA